MFTRDRRIELDLVIFLLPWEIDAYGRSVEALGRCFQSSHGMTVNLHACLGISSHIVDWNKSAADPRDIVEAFYHINRSVSWIDELHAVVSKADEFRGCVDWRRHHLKRCKAGRLVIWLDTDVVFPANALPAVTYALAEARDEYFIATPQTTRMWDETWDVLVPEELMKEELGHCYRFDPNRVNGLSLAAQNVRLIKSPEFKFAGGWLTVLSSDLLKLVGVPDSFGPYGQEDTFIKIVCEQLQRRGWPITQYILQGLLIAHDLDGARRAKARFKIINDKDREAAHNRSIRDKEVADTLRRLETPADDRFAGQL